MKSIFKNILFVTLICAASTALKAADKADNIVLPTTTLEEETSVQKPQTRPFTNDWATQLCDLEKIVNKKIGTIEKKQGSYINRMLKKLAEHPAEKQKDSVFKTDLKNDKKEVIGTLFLTMPKTPKDSILKCCAYVDYSKLKETSKDLYEFAKNFLRNSQETFNSASSQQKWNIDLENKTIQGLYTFIPIPLEDKPHVACLVATTFSAQNAVGFMEKNAADFPAKASRKRKH